ncbi:MAG: hypothetical protein P4L40_18800 [Terracidiphilus sp.]|nr:hypothetical protein [Terracidiphilus sp.]
MALPTHNPENLDRKAHVHADPVTDSLVREELERVLASSEFQASKLCQSFLRYTVERTLAGEGDQLKERTIGLEAFGKPSSYDPSEDAGVRVKASEVRRRLRAYYLSRPADTKVQIELPAGTYAPEFHHLDVEQPKAPVAGTGISLLRAVLIGAATGVAVLLVVAAIAWWRPRYLQIDASLRDFWQPVFESQKPALICAAPVPVYSDIHNPSSNPPSRVEDFDQVTSQFVSIADINSSLRIADLLGRMREPYKLRVGKEVSFGDLRTGPAVLVGFTYTQWKEIGEHFRYTIDLSRRPLGISENGAPTKWNIGTHPDDPNLQEDYAIISRFFYPDTNEMVVQITGISHYGTEAAGDLVTNPAVLSQVLKKLPAGWQKKNLQIVIHVDVISGFPSVPTVVATYVW